MKVSELREILTPEEYIKTIQNDKAELIKSGAFKDYRKAIKDQYNEGYSSPNDDPAFYGVSEYEKELLDSLQRSTKLKKSEIRKHAYFMHEFYENVGFLTLSFSNRKLDSSSFEWKREVVTNVLKNCFLDYIGKFELSPKGRIHFHGIVAWNGTVSTIDRYDNGHKNKIVLNANKLKEEWFGERQENGQPSKYGIYDLILVNRNATKKETDKVANYMMKTLNTMESYITKDEQLDEDVAIDTELLQKVNQSNIITARGTPYQTWKKEKDEQDTFIKRQARIFESSFYEENKYGTRKNFREWAEKNKGVLLTENGKDGQPLYLIPQDYKTIEVDDYKGGDAECIT